MRAQERGFASGRINAKKVHVLPIRHIEAAEIGKPDYGQWLALAIASTRV